jgi:hypothetical protein
MCEYGFVPTSSIKISLFCNPNTIITKHYSKKFVLSSFVNSLNNILNRLSFEKNINNIIIFF